MKNTVPGMLNHLYVCGKTVTVLTEDEAPHTRELLALRVRELPIRPGRPRTLEITAYVKDGAVSQARCFELLLARLPGIMKPPVPSRSGGMIRIACGCALTDCSSRRE